MSNSPAAVNTHDLAKDLAESEPGKALGLSVTKSQELILALTAAIAGHLAKHEIVRIHQLGNFKVLATKERQGKNPKTGESIKIEAGYRVHLAVSEHLKSSAVNRKVPTREPRQPGARAAKPAAAAPAKPAAAKSPAQKAQKAVAAAAPAKPPGAPSGGFRPGQASSDEV